MIRSASTTGPAAHDADGAAGHVCPFCGLTREITSDFDPASPCPRCTLSDTPQTRNATKLRVGPWHVRQVRNPWAPGMRFETLLALVKRGQVTRDSIVRGPTTFQLWKRASEVRGLSREFGLCYSCLGEVDPQAKTCPHCNRMQDPPANPDALLEARDGSPRAAAAPGAVAAGPVTAGPVTGGPATGGPVMGARVAADPADEPASLEMASSTPSMPAGSDPADLLAIGDERSDDAETKGQAGRPVSERNNPVGDAPAGTPSASPEKQPVSAGPAAVKPTGSRAPEKPDAVGKSQRPARPMQSPPTPPTRNGGKPGAAKPPVEQSSPVKPPIEKSSSATSSSETSASDIPPPPKDRPLTIRPRTPGAEDALLTPQELAAAFQLDFSPQAGERRGGSRLAGVVLAVVLLGAGAAALLYLRPDFRSSASAWWSGTWASARDFVSSRTVATKSDDAGRARSAASNRAAPPPATRNRPVAVAPPAGKEPDVSADPVSQPVVAAPMTKEDPPTTSQTLSALQSPQAPSPAVMETPEPPADPEENVAADGAPAGDVATETTAPAESPANELAEAAGTPPGPVEPVVRPVPATASPEPAPPVAGQSRTPTSAPPAPAPAPAPAPTVSKAAPTSANAYEEARRLLGKALDAEENQDYVEAVRCYEAIKRLPVDARAMGIDVRLARARKLIQ